LPIPAIGLAVAVTLLFFGYAFARWVTLQSSAFDLAYFDQVVWNASRGHGFVSSFTPYPFFGQHFSPALALLVPLYWIHPSPLWLLGAQSVALGAAIVPLYLFARTWLSHRAALMACAVYAAQPFVIRAVGYDFHTEALAVPFMFAAVLGAVRASRSGDLVVVLAGSAPMLVKEDGALVSLGIGFLALTVFRRRAGLVLGALALVYGLAVTTVVMPAIRAGQPGDLVHRYAYLGSSVPQILLGLVSHPWIAALHVLRPGPLSAVALMLGAVAFMPLARPLALAAALPSAVFELLSAHLQQSTLLDQYGLQPGPLVFVAAILGWVRISPALAAWAHWPAATRYAPALLAVILPALLLAAPVPGLGPLDSGRDALALASAVPPDVPVAASNGLATMLAERPSIAVLPAHEEGWLAVDGSAETAEFMSGLPRQGYVEVGRWGVMSLWRSES
jgi:uncharacterized membrane protein